MSIRHSVIRLAARSHNQSDCQEDLLVRTQTRFPKRTQKKKRNIDSSDNTRLTERILNSLCQETKPIGIY